MIMYSNTTGTHLSRKNRFSEVVQAEAVEEYRRSLLVPLPYGSLNPKLASLRKHVQQGDNKVAETTVALAFGALASGVGIETVCKPFRVIEGMLRAQVPTPPRSLIEMQQMETQIDSLTDCLQMRFMAGDRTERTKREMLESFENVHKISGEICEQLRRELFGGPKAG